MERVRTENNNTAAEWDAIYEGDDAERWTIWRDDNLVSLFADRIPRDVRIIDIASGNGLALRFIAAKRPDLRFSVADFSIAACRFMFRLRFPFELVEQADLNQRLPFDDGAFDAVMCSEAIEHTENPEASVRELIRVATDLVVVTVPLENATDSKFHLWSISEADLRTWFADCPKVEIVRAREDRILVCFAWKGKS